MSPHPIERLRWVARAEGAGATLLAREAAGALATIGDDLPGLLTGCRRLLDRHPAVGPLWWLSARALVAEHPSAELYGAMSELDGDGTVAVLAAHLPDDATAVVLGWPEQVGDALRRRGDVEVLVVDSRGEGHGFARRLDADGVEVIEVAESGLGCAVREADVVLLEASALGPTGWIGVAGSLAAAAVARGLDKEVWVAAGVGRVLPRRLWEALLARLDAEDDPWALEDEVVPLDWVTNVVGPAAVTGAADAVRRADCPVVPELLRWGS